MQQAMQASKRVLYSVSGLPEWVALAKRLQSKHGWQPCYWIIPHQTEPDVRRDFAGAVVHPFLDAVAGIPAREFGDSRLEPLDAGVISRFTRFETTTYQLMDRMDAGDAFPYGERRRHYLKLLQYWRTVVHALEPDLAFFTESPHSVPQYILYAVCLEECVPTLMFTELTIPGRAWVQSRLEELPPRLSQDYAKQCGSPDEGLATVPLEIQSYVRKLRGSYQQAYKAGDLAYHHGQSRSPFWLLQRLAKVHRWPAFLARNLAILLNSGPVPPSDMKQRGKPASQLTMTPREWRAYNRHATRRKKELGRRYSALSEAPDTSKPYVYCALHYQPERTSVPEGGLFADQWSLVNLLSRTMPDGWELYVKEHPRQFDLMSHGHLGRTPEFYEELSQFPNVRLIHASCSSFDLIDGARAVATLTGRSGWEAVLRGTPSLVAGYAWYRMCEGAFPVRTAEDIRRAIARIRDGYTIDPRKVEAFIRAAVNMSVRTALNPGTRLRYAVGYEENLRGLISALDAYLNSSASVMEIKA